jgi:flagellar assembly protein FliH
LTNEPRIALEHISESLRMAMGMTEIKLHISPTDHANLGAEIYRLASTLAQLAPSDIVADPDISPGGCRIETKFGEIDHTIESQLKRIEQELA